jgi:hypothetical protein
MVLRHHTELWDIGGLSFLAQLSTALFWESENRMHGELKRSDVIKCLMKGKYWFSDRTRDLLLLTAMDKLDYLLRHSRSSWTPCQGFHLVALLDT